MTNLQETTISLLEERGKEIAQLRKERDELIAIRASLSQRNAELWERDRNCFEQLAATEALLATYREALEKALTWGNTGIPVFDVQNVIEKALTLPFPKAALNSYVADELKRVVDVHEILGGVPLQNLRDREKVLREEK